VEEAAQAETVIPLTHEVLVARAARWLTSTRRCCPVLTELNTRAWEIPDAIGWHGDSSILVECKVSRADLLANAEKPHMRGERGMGNERFFLTPPSLVQDGESLPEGWGLLEYDGLRVSVRRPAVRRASDDGSEISMLCSCLRRVSLRVRPLSLTEFLSAVKGTIEPAYRVLKYARFVELEEKARRYDQARRA
jgi:hypothetical protein